jgi:hypothetical protein
MNEVEFEKKVKELETTKDKDEALRMLKKVQKIQREKHTIKNSIVEDFNKGCARNVPCPVCDKKRKKCCCGFFLPLNKEST